MSFAALIDAWILTSMQAVAMVVLSAAAIYVVLMICTRLAGLRSFSKMSSFDFAITVAIGSVVGSSILSENPPILQAVAGLAALYALQILVAVARVRSEGTRTVVDNEPLLLMRGSEILEENLHRARVTKADLLAKLRAANVLNLDQVRAVVMESTGDVSVLHGPSEGPILMPGLLEGVRDADGRSSGS